MPTLFQQLRTLRDSRMEHYPWGPHGPYIASPWAAARLGKRVFASKAEYRKLVLKDYKPYGRHHPAAVAARIAARQATTAMDVDSWDEGDPCSLINDQHLRRLKRRACGDVDLRMGHDVRRCVRTFEEEFEIRSDITAFMALRPMDDHRDKTHRAAYSQGDCNTVKAEPTEGMIPAPNPGAEVRSSVKQEDQEQPLRFAQPLTYIHEQPIVVAPDTPATAESQVVHEVATEATPQVVPSIVEVEPLASVQVTHTLKGSMVEPTLATPPRDEIAVSMSIDLIPPTACAWADEDLGVEHGHVIVGANCGPEVKNEQEEVVIPPALIAAAQALDHPPRCINSGFKDSFRLPPAFIEEDIEMAQPQASAEVAPCPDVKEEELDDVHLDDLSMTFAPYGRPVQPPAALLSVLPRAPSVSLPEEDVEMGVPVALLEAAPLVVPVEPTIPIVHDVPAVLVESRIKAEPEDDAVNLLGTSEVRPEALLAKEEPAELALPCLQFVSEFPPAQLESEPAPATIQPEDDLAPTPCPLEDHTAPAPVQDVPDFTISLCFEGDSALVSFTEELLVASESAASEDATPDASEVVEELSASGVLEDCATEDTPDELLPSEEDSVELGTTEVQVTIYDLDVPTCSPSLHSVHQPRDVDLEDEDVVQEVDESELSESTQVVLDCSSVADEGSLADEDAPADEDTLADRNSSADEDSPADADVSVEEDVETCVVQDESLPVEPVHSLDEESGSETLDAQNESQIPGSWTPVPAGATPGFGASSWFCFRLGSVAGKWSRRLAKTLADVSHAMISEDNASIEPFPAMVGAYPPDNRVSDTEVPSPSPALTLSSSVLAILQEFACGPSLTPWRDDIEASLWPLSRSPSLACLDPEQLPGQPQPGSPEFASNFAQAPFPELVCRPPLLSIPPRVPSCSHSEAILEHNPRDHLEAQDEAFNAPLLQSDAHMQSLGFFQCVTPFITALDFFDTPYGLAPESQAEEECPSDSDVTCVSSERDEDTGLKVIDESDDQESPSATSRCDVQEGAVRTVHQRCAAESPCTTLEAIWESARAQLYTEQAIAERAAQRQAQRQSQIAQAFVDQIIADIRRGPVLESEPEPQHVAEQLDPMEEYMLSVEGIYKEVDDLLELYTPPEEPTRTLFDEAPELAVASEEDSEEYWRTRATIDLSAPGPFSDRLVKAARESFWSNWTRPSVEDLAAVFKPSEVVVKRSYAPLPTPTKDTPISPADHYRESLVEEARESFWKQWTRPSHLDLAVVFKGSGVTPSGSATSMGEDERELPPPITYVFSPVKPLRIVKKNKASAPLN
ncbi:hypothetical protein GY45DRAFT_53316 [Cubamyces sp. BRFM 1775]|nr:hypothetical protein GY45DRAFT_53316 [Cubamyces sp. BRFM 1775]